MPAKMDQLVKKYANLFLSFFLQKAAFVLQSFLKLFFFYFLETFENYIIILTEIVRMMISQKPNVDLFCFTKQGDKGWNGPRGERGLLGERVLVLTNVLL